MAAENWRETELLAIPNSESETGPHAQECHYHFKLLCTYQLHPESFNTAKLRYFTK